MLKRTLFGLSAAALLLLIGGCAEVRPSFWQGNLVEKNLSDGRSYRLWAGPIEGWEAYDHNRVKGDGDSCMLKAEATF